MEDRDRVNLEFVDVGKLGILNSIILYINICGEYSKRRFEHWKYLLHCSTELRIIQFSTL